MTRIWIKKAPLCLALTLFALPAMADNIFSGVINFGREILDETRKLAPGMQNDRRHETPADVRSALNDGRDRPAIEVPSNDQYNNQSDHRSNNQQSGNIQSGSNNANIELAPPVNGQPTGSNLNYTYGDSQRSNTSQRQHSATSSNNHNNQQNVNDNQGSDNNSRQYDNQGFNDNRGSDDNQGANDNYGSDQNYNQEAQQPAPQGNFGWQEESNL